MRCRRAQNRVRPTQVAVDFLETSQETRQRSRADGDMVTDLYISPTQFAQALPVHVLSCPGLPTHSRSSGSCSQKREWISRIPSLVTARPFKPPLSIHLWTVICAFRFQLQVALLRGSLL